MIVCRLSLAADEQISGPVAKFVERLARHAGLTSRQTYRLRLAVDEITTNVAHHGYGDAEGVIDLSGWMDNDRVWVRIEDDAPPFDPRQHDPSPRLAAGPAQREAGGLGLFLARKGVDEFGYDRIRGRNRNTLVICRGATTTGAGVEKGGADARDAGIGGR
jgi:anti-sigma regulatory factor (Ser/Thr protein kinase)